MKLIAKLFAVKIKLDGTSRLQKLRHNNHIFNISSSKNKDIGSSMVELLLATTLALVAVNASAQLISRLYTSGINSRAAANSAVEVAINNDLAWFRRYAVRWLTENESYFEPPGAPGCGETTPPATTMANAFLTYANTSTTYSPSTDTNTVPNSTISLPDSASGYTLSRVIQPDDNVSGALKITYTLTDSGTSTPIFVRSSSLYLPAAGWCPP
jgi:hypothetical protein